MLAARPSWNFCSYVNLPNFDNLQVRSLFRETRQHEVLQQPISQKDLKPPEIKENTT